jgi:hypothetical protein
MKSDWFVTRARKIHGDKYNYSRVKYEHCQTKVIIICKIHGVFKQTPSSHLYGCGCPKCGHLRRAKSQCLTTEQFVAKARAVHGDKYDYSQSKYERYNSKVIIICQTHGPFRQAPDSHTHGSGCPSCGNVRRSMALRLTTEQFLAKARAVHGDKYDYSQSRYAGYNRKLIIICEHHGPFEQDPHTHLHGSGCPDCADDKRWLYLFH